MVKSTYCDWYEFNFAKKHGIFWCNKQKLWITKNLNKNCNNLEYLQLSETYFYKELLKKFNNNFIKGNLTNFTRKENNYKSIYKTVKLLIILGLLSLICSLYFYFIPTITAIIIISVLLFIVSTFFQFFIIIFFRKNTNKKQKRAFLMPFRIKPSKNKKTISAKTNTICHPKKITKFSLIVPLYKEEKSVQSLIKHLYQMETINHKIEIFFVCEEDDKATNDAVSFYLQQQNLSSPSIKSQLLIIPNNPIKTKPNALNYALSLCDGEITVVYDAEDRPSKDQLTKFLQQYYHDNLKPNNIVCYQAPLNFYNPYSSWLATLFTLEYSLLFDNIIPSLAKLKMFFPLGGTSNFFLTDHLKTMNGWDNYNVTEDVDISIRIQNKYQHCSFFDSTTYEEAVSELKPWIQQRTRWLKGFIQCYFMYILNRYNNKQISLVNHIIINILIGTKILLPLLLPINIIFTFILINNKDLSILNIPIILITALLLLCHIMLITLLYRAGRKRNISFALLFSLCSPIYGTLNFIPAWLAIFELLYKPFYWSKTKHFTKLNPNKIKFD